MEMDSLVENFQRIKMGIHIAQAVFIFVSWCIMIAVFRNAFLVTASPGWYFALCFLTIPAIIYQTMTPLWERSRKWGNPYAFCAIDVAYTILWLSAFASVAAWNTSSLCFGACDLSKACVGLGFFVFLFFGLTSAMSIYGLVYYQRNGSLPGGSKLPNASTIDPDREAFSTAPHDDEYAPVHMNDKDDGHHEMDAHGPSGAGHYDPVSYHQTGGTSYVSPMVSDTSYRTYGSEPPSHMGYGDADAERVHFPVGNYNNV